MSLQQTPMAMDAMTGSNRPKEMDHYPPQSEGYFNLDNPQQPHRDGSPDIRSRHSSLSIAMPPSHTTMDMAYTAMQYLPMPMLVLSDAKTIVLANEAMGRLLGIDMDVIRARDELGQGPQSAAEVLCGTSIRTLGIDLLQNGSPLWVTWEDFLNSLLEDARQGVGPDMTSATDGESTPRAAGGIVAQGLTRTSTLSRTTVHDVAVDIVFSKQRDPLTGLPVRTQLDDKGNVTTATVADQVEATLIISTWFRDDAQFFTLTFTAATTTSAPSSRTSQRSVPRAHKSYTSGMGSNSSSSSSGHRNQPSASSIGSGSTRTSYSIPKGPATAANQGTSSSMLAKSLRLKDAILNAIPMPTHAMWKDEAFGFPNKAVLDLLGPERDPNAATGEAEQEDFLRRYTLYDGTFTRELPLEEFPIMKLMRTQKRFQNDRIGIQLRNNERRLYDVDGEEVRDEQTGEFLGGLIVLKDVTSYANIITAQQSQNERQFEDICNMIPTLIWCTTDTGQHDYYSNRWYDYTGLTVEESMGEGWRNAFHSDDLGVAGERWAHSLKTGDEYITEYRCRSKEGTYRWFLGRALPLRDGTGKIVRWYASFLLLLSSITDLCSQVWNMYRYS